MPTDSSLLAGLRRRIQDVRYSRRALTVSISDQQVTSAIAELSGGCLSIQVSGGTAPSIDFDLTSSRYDTVGKLYQVLSRISGYSVQRDPDGNQDHISVDIEAFPPLLIQSTGVELTHHLFSDSELEEILKQAITRHNPSFRMEDIPPQEMDLIMPLAQALICRVQANDASKRKGIDKDVHALIALADSFDRQYRDDVERLARAIQSPKEANPDIMEEGDVVLGTLVRRSLRTGMMTPLSAAKRPTAPVLKDPNDQDVEDIDVRVCWQKNKDYSFYAYELWIDSRPDVTRRDDGDLMFAGTPVVIGTGNGGLYNEARRDTSSTLVFRSFGANSNSSQSSFSTFVEQFGQSITSFAVANLEPNTDYYWRLYVYDVNYQWLSSNVVHARTKSLRTRFIPWSQNVNNPSAPFGIPLSNMQPVAGSTLVASLDTTASPFTAQCILKIAEKVIVPTITNGGYTLTFVVPTWQSYGVKDVTIVSPNGLSSSVRHGFNVLPPSS